MAYTFLNHTAIFLRQIGSYNTHRKPIIYPGLWQALQSTLCTLCITSSQAQCYVSPALGLYRIHNITKIISWKSTASSHWYFCFKMKNTEQVLKSWTAANIHFIIKLLCVKILIMESAINISQSADLERWRQACIQVTSSIKYLTAVFLNPKMQNLSWNINIKRKPLSGTCSAGIFYSDVMKKLT